MYDAVCEAALDEPSAVANDDIGLDEYLAEWDDPDLDLSLLRCGARRGAGGLVRDDGRRRRSGSARVHRDAPRLSGPWTRDETAKRFALRAAAAQEVTRVTTSNAEENAAMRAINRGLGFEQIGEHVILGRDLSGESA